ncbi:MAG: hypothetical protein GX452_01700 [Ignavibacteriales bacterium]|nr:hypothetical protein [Ignavibacteriales bacterium]
MPKTPFSTRINQLSGNYITANTAFQSDTYNGRTSAGLTIATTVANGVNISTTKLDVTSQSKVKLNIDADSSIVKVDSLLYATNVKTTGTIQAGTWFVGNSDAYGLYYNGTSVGFLGKGGSNSFIMGNASLSLGASTGAMTGDLYCDDIYMDGALDRDSLTFRTEASKIDSATIISLATGKAGWGEIMIGDAQEWATFHFTSAGAVTLRTNSTNVSTTPFNANTLNIYDAGTNVAIQNYLSAGQLKVAINVKYFTP